MRKTVHRREPDRNGGYRCLSVEIVAIIRRGKNEITMNSGLGPIGEKEEGKNEKVVATMDRSKASTRRLLLVRKEKKI